MFQKSLFKEIPREEIKRSMQEEGFSPLVITDKPGFVYDPHEHPETKYLVCLEGSMKVTVKGETYDFEAGDKLIIPGNTTHSGIVGKEGCIFFWSEKIVK
jgi:quercetin dioxygenase-like cupin family protein